MLAENKLPQELVSFSRENAPISVGIIFDRSASMTKTIVKARTAVEEFLRNLDPEDEEFLVTFADAPELISVFTSEPAVIHAALLSASPRGRTALFDAVALAIREMHNSRHERRILLLISDGGDNHSRFSGGELRHLVEEEDIQIHAIGIHDHKTSMAESRGAQILKDLAAVTGGQYHPVDYVAELPALAKRISLSLHDRYLLGYRPTPAGLSGTFQRIEVKVKQPKGVPRVYVYARGGYRMP
jgi:Ca-activated chloride channel family protein